MLIASLPCQKTKTKTKTKTWFKQGELLHLGCILTIVPKGFISCLYATIIKHCMGARHWKRKAQCLPLISAHTQQHATLPWAAQPVSSFCACPTKGLKLANHLTLTRFNICSSSSGWNTWCVLNAVAGDRWSSQSNHALLKIKCFLMLSNLENYFIWKNDTS